MATADSTTTDSTTNVDSVTSVLVIGTEYAVKRAVKSISRLLLWLHVDHHSIICFFKHPYGNTLTDEQIVRVNNGSGSIACIYAGTTDMGEHIFIVKDYIHPTQSVRILMEEID